MARVDFLPKTGTPDSLLSWVIAVMVYLTALAMGAGLALHDSAGQWRQEIARALTVQIIGGTQQAMDDETEAALGVLRGFPGVQSADKLERDEIAALLEPWLGTGNLSADLPLPQLIDVLLEPDAKVNLPSLRRALAGAAPHAQLDDHDQWLGRIIDLAVSLQIIAVGIIVLISLITMAIIVFATRAGLATHREIIEIVHLIGARDAVIASEFQRRFLVVGLKGGFIGLLVAVLTMLGLAQIMLELQASFLPRLSLTPGIAVGLAALPFLIGLLAMLTANVTVRQTLSRMM